jgi:uncharacterized protein
VIDGHFTVDAHLHPARLDTLRPAWLRWARDFGGDPPLDHFYDGSGTVVPERLDAYLDGQGVDVAVLLCEYSPKATGIQPVEDLLPIVAHNPVRFRFLGNLNPHYHHPLLPELERQVELGACGVKIHPVHGGFPVNDRALYPVYQVCSELGLPVVVHCGTSTFPGSENRFATPEPLRDVVRDFPALTLVLAHAGRSWWYDEAAALALAHETVWLELSGLPPRRLPEYFAGHDLGRLARRFVFGTDWPGVPGIARNARAIAALGLDEETLGLVLGGNATRVYPTLAPV